MVGGGGLGRGKRNQGLDGGLGGMLSVRPSGGPPGFLFAVWQVAGVRRTRGSSVLLAFLSWLRISGRHWNSCRQLSPRPLAPPR